MVRESVKAPLYPSDPPRVKRTHAANQMKRVQGGRCAASTCCRATLHDLPDQPQCGLRLLEPGRSPLYTQAPSRVKRTHAANQMKRVQRVNDSLAQVWGRGRSAASTCCRATLHDLPGQPQCGLRLLEPSRSPLYTQAPSCVKRTHTANQMKRVQRVEDSLAQSGARSPSVLPAENTAKPIRSHKNALCRAADSVPSSPAFSPSPSFSVGIAIKNAQTRSEPAKSDNRTTSENARMAITTHGGTGTKHIASRLSFPDKGKETGVSRTQDLPIETYGGCEPNIRHRNRTAYQA